MVGRIAGLPHAAGTLVPASKVLVVAVLANCLLLQAGVQISIGLLVECADDTTI